MAIQQTYFSSLHAVKSATLVQEKVHQCSRGHDSHSLNRDDVTAICCRKLSETYKIIIYDLTQLPLYQFVGCNMLPEYLEDFHSVRASYEKTIQSHNMAGGASDQLCKAISAVYRIEHIFPVLNDIASKLYNSMPEAQRNLLLRKHQQCPIVHFHDVRYCCRDKKMIFYSLRDEILQQQSIAVPDFQSWIGMGKTNKGKLLDRLLTKELIGEGFTYANPFIFRGYIPQKYAEHIAKDSLFMEASDSITMLHGSRTHVFQTVSFLKWKQNGIEQFREVVEKNLWDKVFDWLVHKEDAFTWFASAAQYVFHGLSAKLTLISAESVNLLFLEKTLSSTVRSILDKGDLHCKVDFLMKFGVSTDKHNPDHIDAQLRLLANHLSLLESYIIDSQYNALYRAGYTQLPIDTNDAYLFVSPIQQSDYRAICKSLRKGYTVALVYKKTTSCEIAHKFLDSEQQLSDEWAALQYYPIVGFIIDKHLSDKAESSLRSRLSTLS